MADIRVTSVTFGDRIEVSYVEDREVYPDGGFQGRTLVVPPRAVPEELVAEAFEAVQAIVDDYLRRQRLPEERLK